MRITFLGRGARRQSCRGYCAGEEAFADIGGRGNNFPGINAVADADPRLTWI